MTKTLRPDICVIGAGSGGLTVAAIAASFGIPVVLVEKGRMGGDCLNYGCVPSKALIAAARHAQSMREGAGFGIGEVEPEIDFQKVMAHVHSVIAAIAPNDSVERFTGLGVHVIQAEARFIDKDTVAAGDCEIRARRFVLATGSSPTVPPISGIETVPYLTNETVFDLTERPDHLIILGGGPIGVELAQAFRRLGSAVTVVEAERILGREEREFADIVLARLRSEGVSICEGCKATHVESSAQGGIRLRIDAEAGSESLEGSHLLIAASRSPNVSGLELDLAGIAHGPQGIEVDARLRTSNRRAYAIGDAAGGPQFTHVANYHAGLVARSIIFRLPVSVGNGAIPRVTYSQPELAHVGLDEGQARARHGEITVLRWPFSDNDRAQTERQTEGCVKIVVGRRGRILGASIVGANAGELIGFWSLALSKKMTIRDVTGYIAPYPTLGEAGKRAAITYFMGATKKPLVRAIVRMLRIFG